MANNNAQALTLVASTANSANWSFWADYILVENQSTAVVYVRADGTAATIPASGAIPETAVPVGSAVLVENAQPKVNTMQHPGSGGLDNDGNANGVGVTAQTMVNPASGFPTFVSVISTGTGVVLVEPR